METLLGRTLDFDDLASAPEDGNCYEILDAALVMSPPPGAAHQRASFRLSLLLHQAAAPAGLEVLPAPFAWRIGPGQVPEPDLIVAAPEVITERAIEGAPVIVVEVLSASGRDRDLFDKRRIYAAGGAAWYWVVDPAEPSLNVLRLSGGAYIDEAHVVGGAVYETQRPFPIKVVPAELVP